MKYSIMIGFSLLVSIFIFLPTAHADSGELYKVDSETVTLRDAPDQQATEVTKLENGDKVTVFQESSSWGRTFYQGEEAWVALQQLATEDDTQTDQEDTEETNTNEPSPSSDETLENGKRYQVKTPAIRLHNAPNMQATVLTELESGDEVTIFQESDGWGKTFYNSEEVWIKLTLLDKNDDTTDNESSRDHEKAESKQDLSEDEKEKSASEPDRKEDDKKKDADEAKDDESKDKKVRPDDQTKQNDKKPLTGYHFVIDPGHGGKDTGAVASEVYEKTLTLATAKKVEEQLQDNGASVTLSRSDDTFIPLGERADMSDSEDADAFISLHYNAAEIQSARGIDTFYYHGDDQTLANSIQHSLAQHVNLSDLGTKQADFQVLRDNKRPAVLVELGFISNPEERKLVQTDSYQEKAAKGIVAGLEDYFND